MYHLHSVVYSGGATDICGWKWSDLLLKVEFFMLEPTRHVYHTKPSFVFLLTQFTEMSWKVQPHKYENLSFLKVLLRLYKSKSFYQYQIHV